MNLWHTGFLLLIAIVVVLFLRSLHLGDKFRARQEERRQQLLEIKRREAELLHELAKKKQSDPNRASQH